MSVVKEIMAAIRRDPNISRVVISEREMEMVRNEYLDLQPGGPIVGDSRKWALANLRYGPTEIMGRPVTARETMVA